MTLHDVLSCPPSCWTVRAFRRAALSIRHCTCPLRAAPGEKGKTLSACSQLSSQHQHASVASVSQCRTVQGVRAIAAAIRKGFSRAARPRMPAAGGGCHPFSSSEKKAPPLSLSRRDLPATAPAAFPPSESEKISWHSSWLLWAAACQN